MQIPAHIIDFKDDQTRKEFYKIKPRLQAFILAAGSFMSFRYGITLVVTDLMRDNKKSPHHWGNAVDFRTRDLTEEQGTALVEFLKWQYPYNLGQISGEVKYSIRDEREPGTSEDWNGPHIHGQVNWREANA